MAAFWRCAKSNSGFGSPIGSLPVATIDPRASDQITHSLADVIRFLDFRDDQRRATMDGNDANALRR